MHSPCNVTEPSPGATLAETFGQAFGRAGVRPQHLELRQCEHVCHERSQVKDESHREPEQPDAGNAQKQARGPIEDASEEKEQAAPTASAGISWSFSSIPVFPSDSTDSPNGSSSRGSARAHRDLQAK